MLPGIEILKMIVGLKEVNDLDLLEDAVLNTICVASDKTTIQAMAAIIDLIYDEFDYESSPEFLQKIEGKSEQLQAMFRKLLDKEKLNEARKRLGRSITAILNSRDAYNLVAVPHHQRLRELKELTESLSEPT